MAQPTTRQHLEQIRQCAANALNAYDDGDRHAAQQYAVEGLRSASYALEGLGAEGATASAQPTPRPSPTGEPQSPPRP